MIRIKGEEYIVESYYLGGKNLHDTVVGLAESQAYDELLRKRKIKGAESV